MFHLRLTCLLLRPMLLLKALIVNLLIILTGVPVSLANVPVTKANRKTTVHLHILVLLFSSIVSTHNAPSAAFEMPLQEDDLSS